jgi:hypothetical protein
MSARHCGPWSSRTRKPAPPARAIATCRSVVAVRAGLIVGVEQSRAARPCRTAVPAVSAEPTVPAPASSPHQLRELGPVRRNDNCDTPAVATVSTSAAITAVRSVTAPASGTAGRARRAVDSIGARPSVPAIAAPRIDLQPLRQPHRARVGEDVVGLRIARLNRCDIEALIEGGMVTSSCTVTSGPSPPRKPGPPNEPEYVNRWSMHSYVGGTTTVVVIPGLARSVAVRRKPVDSVASGLDSADQSPLSRATASGL